MGGRKQHDGHVCCNPAQVQDVLLHGRPRAPHEDGVFRQPAATAIVRPGRPVCWGRRAVHRPCVLPLAVAAKTDDEIADLRAIF